MVIGCVVSCTARFASLLVVMVMAWKGKEWVGVGCVFTILIIDIRFIVIIIHISLLFVKNAYRSTLPIL